MTSSLETSAQIPEAQNRTAVQELAGKSNFQKPPLPLSGRKPKLAIITELIAPYRIPVFNALAERKELDLHVIFLSENDRGMRQWRVYKEEIAFRYEVLPSWRAQFSGWKILLNRGIARALNATAPDVILCGGYNYPASWQAALWAKKSRVPFWLWSESTASDSRTHSFAIEALKTRFLNLCSAFVVPGVAAADYLGGLGVGAKPIFTAPNAVDIRLFSGEADRSRANETKLRAELGLSSRYFLYVGRLLKEKGIFEILQAYARLDEDTRKQIGLVFAGDGPDRSRLIQSASKIETGKVQFPGFVHRDRLPNFYALAEALVFPTHTDPWGLVVNEAMSCGLPIITTNVAGCARDLVANEWNGFLVASRDVHGIAQAMSSLATDGALRKLMGERSRQRIANYSPENWASGIVNALSVEWFTRNE